MAWTTPATVTTSQLMTAAFWNTQVRDNLSFIDGRRVGYAVVTTGQTGIGTSQTDLTGLSVTFTAATGRYYKVKAGLTFVRGAGSPTAAIAQIKEGDGSPVYQEIFVETPSTSYSLSVERSVILQTGVDLTAGSETVKVSAAANVATDVSLSALTTRPAFLLVEEIGS